MGLCAALDQRRQIPPQVAALAKEHRHDGDVLHTGGSKFVDRARQVGCHQLKKGKTDVNVGLLGGQALLQTVERLAPASIARAMRKQHECARGHQ